MVDRCNALLPRLDIEPDAEKRVKALRKKLIDIDKLKDKKASEGKLDKLQEDKIAGEADLLRELNGIETQFPPKPKEEEKPVPVYEAAKAIRASSGKGYKGSKGSKGSGKGYKGGKGAAAAEEEIEESEEEEEDAGPAPDKTLAKESTDLKTKRQQAAVASAPKERVLHEVDAKAATWPEVQDVASSGDGGVDKGRQKHALVVTQPKGGPPYTSFDNYIWKFSFLTRLELRLPPGVLAGADFQECFPGQMVELVELILKENELTVLPVGLSRLTRLRSLDISHNAIECLPEAETWETFSSCLENLDLGFNKLTSVEPLAPLCKLSSLKLDGNKINSLDGVSFGALKQLTNLTAVGNEIAEIPESIGEAGESLMHLDLSENKIVALPEQVCELKKLKDLGATGCPIKDQKVVKYLEKGGKGLKELMLYLQKPQKGKKK